MPKITIQTPCWSELEFWKIKLENSSPHSMATANLKKGEEFVTNTTAASKYIPRRSRISINWNPTFQTSLHKISKEVFFRLTKFFFALLYIKNRIKVVPWKFFFVPEKKIVSLKKNLKKKFVSGTHRGRFQFMVILTP